MKKLFFLWLFILIVYLLVAGKGKFSWHTTQRNFFSLQAYSWMQGHLDLVALPKDITDLSIYNGKVYMYYPPLPALFALPFVIIFGLNVSDIFYTAFYSSFAPILIYILLNKAKQAHLIPPLTEIYTILLTLFFAFGTVFFYLSMLGTVWFTSQVLAELVLIISLVFLIDYVIDKHKMSFNISVVLLCLAFWCRTELILALPLYMYILLRTKTREKKLLIVSMFGILLVNMIIYGFYNYIRFNNWMETGLNYMMNDPRFRYTQKIGFFNLRYLPHNVFYFLVNPIGFKTTFPYIWPDPEGNSIFSTSPLFILLFGLITKKLFNPRNLFLPVLLLTTGIILLTILLYGSTGWFQFGYRYSLDVMPLLILILAWVINKFPKFIVVSLFALSVVINTLGTFWMQSIAALLRY